MRKHIPTRLFVALALVLGTLAVAQPAHAQGCTFGVEIVTINGAVTARPVTNCDNEPQPEPAGPFCEGLEATIVGTSGDDILTGTNGPDVIVALGGHDIIRGLDGNDTICGGSGKDRILGGRGHDEIFGGGGRDIIAGQAGRDKLDGGTGNDRLIGGRADDVLHPGDEPWDLAIGGLGTDLCSGTRVRRCE